MYTIWKFTLEKITEQKIEIPAQALILTVQMLEGNVCLWAMVNTDMPKTKKSIVLLGTGETVTHIKHGVPALHYLATVQDRVYVWHVFENFDF